VARDRPAEGKRARLFLALDFAPAEREALAAWRDGAIVGRDDLRPVAAEALHVTLVFLGYRPEDEVDAIAEAAFGAVRGMPPAVLVPRRVTGVPRRDPRLFALDLEDEGGRAGALQAAASDALEAGGFHRAEKRDFWPHVTLARVRRGRQPGPVTAEPPTGALEAPEVALYQSLLSPSGARYRALQRLSLAA
jgi:2'-5' RNA ligase